MKSNEEKVLPTIVEVSISKKDANIIQLCRIEDIFTLLNDENHPDKMKLLESLGKEVELFAIKYSAARWSRDVEKYEDLAETIFHLTIQAIEYTKRYDDQSDSIELHKNRLNIFFDAIMKFHLQRINLNIKNLNESSKPYQIEILREEIESLIGKWEKFNNHSTDHSKKMNHAESILELIKKLYVCSSAKMPESCADELDDVLEDLDDVLEDLQDLYIENCEDEVEEKQKLVSKAQELMRALIGDRGQEKIGLIPEVYKKYRLSTGSAQPKLEQLIQQVRAAKYYQKEKDLINAKKILKKLIKTYNAWKIHNLENILQFVEEEMRNLNIFMYGDEPTRYELDLLSGLVHAPFFNKQRIKELLSTAEELFSEPSLPSFMLFQRNEKFAVLRLFNEINDALEIVNMLSSPHFKHLHNKLNESEVALRKILSLKPEAYDILHAESLIEQRQEENWARGLTTPKKSYFTSLKIGLQNLQESTNQALSNFEKNELKEFLVQFDDLKYRDLHSEIMQSKVKLEHLFMQPKKTGTIVRQIEAELIKLTSYLEAPNAQAVEENMPQLEEKSSYKDPSIVTKSLHVRGKFPPSDTPYKSLNRGRGTGLPIAGQFFLPESSDVRRKKMVSLQVDEKGNPLTVDLETLPRRDYNATSEQRLTSILKTNSPHHRLEFTPIKP